MAAPMAVVMAARAAAEMAVAVAVVAAVAAMEVAVAVVAAVAAMAVAAASCLRTLRRGRRRRMRWAVGCAPLFIAGGCEQARVVAR